MVHLIIFYLLVTFVIGIIFTAFSFQYQIKTSDSKIKSFNMFYINLTVLMFLELMSVYVKTNCFPDAMKLYEVLRYLGNPLGLLLLFFTIPFFIHDLTSSANSKIKNTSFGIIAFILLVLNYSISLFSEDETVNYLRILSKDLAFIIIVIYCYFQLFYYQKKLENLKEKKYYFKFTILFGLFLPGIIVDTFFSSYPQFKIFPLIYIITGYTFFNYFSYQNELNISKNRFDQIDLEPMFLDRKFGLTTREMEIIALVITGSTNNKIAEQLFISINTVKSHIRNSYQKLQVNNRLEMINLLNQLPKQ